MKAAWVVDAAGAGARLDKFLAAPDRLGSRSRAATALARGQVWLNEVEVSPADAARALAPGDAVRVWTDRPGSAKRRLGAFVDGDLHVLYEDEALVVVNKPPGLLSVPLERKGEDRSVFTLLESHLRSHRVARPVVVHRIDRDTSGLVLFAKSGAAAAALRAQFRGREPERVYLAVVYGCPSPASGEWRHWLRWNTKALVQQAARRDDPESFEAISQYRVVEPWPLASLIEVRLVTGKRNQIRIQAALCGHPLVGERRYVYEPPATAIPFGRQALHAHALGFRHPTDGRAMRVELPLPDDMARLVEQLRRQARGNALAGLSRD